MAKKCQCCKKGAVEIMYKNIPACLECFKYKQDKLKRMAAAEKHIRAKFPRWIANILVGRKER
jgi:hypothetical protein